MKRFVGIYVLGWELPDVDYFYIGQSNDIKIRWGQHQRALKRGDHDNPILQNLYKKHGMPDIHIAKLCRPSKLDKWEQHFLDIFFDWKSCVNINPTATSSRGRIITEATRLKLRAIRSNTMLSTEHKVNISRGLKRSYSLGFRTKPNLKGKANPFFGRKHTGDALIKMRGVSKGDGPLNNRARLVLNVETGIYYDYAGEAAATIDINPQYLRRMLNGDRKNKTSFVYA